MNTCDCAIEDFPSAPTPAALAPPPSRVWELSWSDKFAGDELDAARWSHDAFARGNNELHQYTPIPANVWVWGGQLEIKALHEAYQGRVYTSGRITTKGKLETTHGRLEARAKVPHATGLWPVFWTLGTNNHRPGALAAVRGDRRDGGVRLRLGRSAFSTIHTKANNHADGTGYYG